MTKDLKIVVKNIQKLTGAYKQILYAVVFARSVGILVKFVDSFNIYVTTIESVGSVAFDSLLP